MVLIKQQAKIGLGIQLEAMSEELIEQQEKNNGQLSVTPPF
jgi:hypothetical protein